MPGCDGGSGSLEKDHALTVRDKVFIIEDEMRKYKQRECPVKHYFSQGVYAREVFIPKDTWLTGHIHKYHQLNILSKGDISVLIDGEFVRVQAPFTIISPPGTKRLAYAHEDTVWTTIHGTDEISLDKIEDQFIAKTDAEYSAFLEQTKVKEIAQCPG